MLWESVVPAARLALPSLQPWLDEEALHKRQTPPKRGLDIRIGTKEAARGGPSSLKSGVLFHLQNLAALIHAGLQVEVVRTAQFAGVLVLNVSGALDRVSRTTHATPRRRCFSSRNGHSSIPCNFLCQTVWAVLSIGARFRAASTKRAGKIADKAGLITDA